MSAQGVGLECGTLQRRGGNNQEKPIYRDQIQVLQNWVGRNFRAKKILKRRALIDLPIKIGFLDSLDRKNGQPAPFFGSPVRFMRILHEPFDAYPNFIRTLS